MRNLLYLFVFAALLLGLRMFFLLLFDVELE